MPHNPHSWDGLVRSGIRLGFCIVQIFIFWLWSEMLEYQFYEKRKGTKKKIFVPLQFATKEFVRYVHYKFNRKESNICNSSLDCVSKLCIQTADPRLSFVLFAA